MNMKCGICGSDKFHLDIENQTLSCSACSFCCDFRALVCGDVVPQARRHAYNPADFEIVGGVLKKYKGSSVDVVVPDGVIEIHADGPFNGVFKDMKHIRSIALPDGLRNIGPYTFLGCSDLREIVLPETLEVIGEKAFAGCSGLTNIRIPDSVTTICKSSTIHNDDTVYVDACFSGCSQLNHAEYPKDRFTYRVLKGTPYYEKMKEMARTTKICPTCGTKWGRVFGCSGCSAIDKRRAELSKQVL